MIVLGIDPGYATTGIGVIEYIGSKITHIHHEVIITKASQDFPDRLLEIAKQLDDIFTTFKPNSVAIESLFFSKNTKTAIDVAQARGVMVLTSRQHKKEVFSYTPPQVKSAVCGYGSAEKKQVQYMVQKLLNLSAIPKPDDAADALAIAICHAHSAKIRSL
jgi:crossover junction endodeoxyribonuclease RuvC